MSVAFCRYLLSHNKVEASAFLEAIDQLRAQTPTLPRLLWDHKLLDVPAMMKAFELQSGQRVSFEASCKALGFWNNKLETALEQILAASHQSIFHVLVERDLITCQQLIAAMDEFLGEHAQPQASNAGEAA